MNKSELKFDQSTPAKGRVRKLVFRCTEKMGCHTILLLAAANLYESFPINIAACEWPLDEEGMSELEHFEKALLDVFKWEDVSEAK